MNSKGYLIVTAAYWGFTITDGALRMLVLLHFHKLGYTPVQIAFLFLLYEFCGILTNFFGSWVGSRTGLKSTLFAGLGLQIIALLMLSLLDTEWTTLFSAGFVMLSQALSGIAKDLTKMSSKSAIKVLMPQDGEPAASEGLLYKLVAILTGSKNALKGFGFFLGAALLSWLGFTNSLWVMAGALFIVLLGSMIFLRGDIGKSKQKTKFSQLFSKSREINLLSIARFFLFGARDVWFVVGLPIFLTERLGWDFWQTGAFLALWVIGYGIIQASAPAITGKNLGAAAWVWGLVLTVVTSGIASALYLNFYPVYSVIVGLAIFGILFAINSAVHSYLILAYSDSDKVTLNVGFYYMANAAGRLVGTLLSGLMYLKTGLVGCLVTSAVFLLIATIFTIPLRKTLSTNRS